MSKKCLTLKIRPWMVHVHFLFLRISAFNKMFKAFWCRLGSDVNAKLLSQFISLLLLVQSFSLSVGELADVYKRAQEDLLLGDLSPGGCGMCRLVALHLHPQEPHCWRITARQRAQWSNLSLSLVFSYTHSIIYTTEYFLYNNSSVSGVYFLFVHSNTSSFL